MVAPPAPDTKERLDLLSVPEDIHPSDCALIVAIIATGRRRRDRFSLVGLSNTSPAA